MINANELKAIRNEVIIEKEMTKIMKAIKEYYDAAENTIDFCENELNNILLEKASSGQPIRYYFKASLTKDYLGNDILQPLYLDGGIYKDGTKSLSRAFSSKEWYSVDTLKEILNTYGYTIAFRKDTYKSYGLGSRECVEIEITC